MTTIASYDAKSREDGGHQWLGWVSMGFLGLNLLLLVTVVFLWQYRSPAGTGVTKEEVSPVVSSIEVAAEAEPAILAPSSSRQTSGEAQNKVYPAQSRGAQTTSPTHERDTAGPSTIPMASGAGLEEHPPAVIPSTTGPDAEAQASSSPTESGVVAGNEANDALASSPQGDTGILPAVSRHTSGVNGVDIFDVVRYANNPKGTDVNGDGMIDVRDVIALDSRFGSGGP